MGFLTRARWLAIALWLTIAVALSAQAPREYDVKAVFLYNFATFVEWPGTAFENPESPFVIGVLGHDPFGKILDDTVAGERVGGRPFVIRRFSRLDDIDDCHILFISRSEEWRLRPILRKTAGRPVLSVADLEGFADAGGMIGFRLDGSRITLEINAARAREAGLTISSKLLRVAKVRGGDALEASER